ncbi:MAG: protocatechuate 3,4-dioxygenase subunit alpha [Ardenticatenaceae bacterium]
MLQQSPSQTVGPFFHDGLIFGGENILVNDRTQGEQIYIEGQVLDGDGVPVVDALVEIWQADANGYFNHPADPGQSKADPFFAGFGRSQSAKEGRLGRATCFGFKTVKPGIIASEDQKQAPHISVHVFARGMLIHALTRLYFSDEHANQSDPVLNSVPEARQHTLIAQRQAVQGLPTYRFDIHLQGEEETVFFNP